MNSSAFHTDHYELTMVDAALRADRGSQPAVFEVFCRALPAGRRYGVVAGIERVLDAVQRFTFGPEELEWLERQGFLSARTMDWLASYRFAGDIYAYPEGELYTGGSPVVTVCAPFAEAVLLETVFLSILNHDSAVAAAASLITAAAGDRPVIEMGGRRTDPEAAVAAARAGYIGGLTSTSNLEAGRRYGVPTAGTTAHAFVLLFPDERQAFAAQIAALGPGTTLLVDTYDTAVALRTAVEAAGPHLGAVRIDSGDLGAEAVRARLMLDQMGATGTRIVVTGDLDEASIARLASTPVDVYGAGTSVVTGGGFPTCGFVYKLVEVDGHPVQKRSPGKATVGGRKWAWRVPEEGEDVVGHHPDQCPEGGRLLTERLVEKGAPVGAGNAAQARARHLAARRELGRDRWLALRRLPAD